MFFLIARLYGYLFKSLKEIFGIQIKGHKFLLEQVRDDHFFTIKGRKMHFNHKVSTCYNKLISDCWTEPETHKILKHVVENIPESCEFIDVGANIGEMVVSMIPYKKVRKIYAFEPIKECSESIKKTLQLNDFHDAKVIDAVVSDSNSPLYFDNKKGNQKGSGVIDYRTDLEAEVYYPTTLDSELPKDVLNPIMLVDVEGFEPNVLRGGLTFIRKNSPLIIFEYNHISKKHFKLDVIQTILSQDKYKIFRLRSDGMLDLEVERSWNCVAVPHGTSFWTICQSQISL